MTKIRFLSLQLDSTTQGHTVSRLLDIQNLFESIQIICCRNGRLRSYIWANSLSEAG